MGFRDWHTILNKPADMHLDRFMHPLFRFLAGFSVNPYVYLHWNFALRRVTFGLRDHYKNYFDWLKTSCTLGTSLPDVVDRAALQNVAKN